jgi:CRISPR-associated protein Csh1
MFGSIAEIGKCVRERHEKTLMGALPIKPIKVPPRRRAEELLVARIIFDLDHASLDCDPNLQYGENRAEEFLWIGNARGQDHQIRLTTDSCEYLLDPNKKHKWGIGEVIKYIDNANLHGDDDVEGLYTLLVEIKRKFFPSGDNLTPKLEEVCREKDVKLNKIVLYTVSIRSHDNLIDIVKEPGYRKLLLHALSYGKTQKYPTGRGRCHICGKEGEVLTNPDYPKGTLLCIYNIDKAGFLSGISRTPESLLRTHAVCVDCKKNLELGINFINNKLSNNIGDLKILIIPAQLGRWLNPSLLDEISNICQGAFNVAKEYGGLTAIEKVEEELGRFLKIGGFHYTVNIIFGHPEQSQFIYQGMIQDVPILTFVNIGNISQKLSGALSKHFYEDAKSWSMGLENIYRIFPMRKMAGDVEPSPFIELLTAMLTGAHYAKDKILMMALLLAKIHRFGNYAGYSVWEVERANRDNMMCRGIILYNGLLKLLIELGLYEMDTGGGALLEGIDEDLARFCEEQGYSEWQTGLFLLGVGIGKIGTEQYIKGDKRKSILEKIDFDGMSQEKIKWLTNVLFEGLRNYRILEYNEIIYAHMKRLIDRNIDKMKNPIDNTFYVLSGYAYATLRAITGGGKA